ncbi:MAG: DUF1801 domain-containing protein [Pedobacter sp.]|nr:DUF1801 domain-containing protein [Pedobacter sp.]
MNTQEQIKTFIASQPEAKGADILALHQLMHQILPDGKLWFHDGTDDQGKVVANPTIGYGLQTMKYAKGKTADWFQVGISANKTGISVYILGIPDKTYLPDTYAKQIGKASVTGYCIRFKALKDINVAGLESAIRDGLRMSGTD